MRKSFDFLMLETIMAKLLRLKLEILNPLTGQKKTVHITQREGESVMETKVRGYMTAIDVLQRQMQEIKK